MYRDVKRWGSHLDMLLSIPVPSSGVTRIPLGGATLYLPPANEVWGKLIFSEACVKNSVHKGGRGGVCGIPACIAGGIPACLAGIQGGGWYPSMPCRSLGPHPRGKLRGQLLGRGLQAHTRGGYPSMHRDRHPPNRWLLLRAVRILLECILVCQNFRKIPWNRKTAILSLCSRGQLFNLKKK